MRLSNILNILESDLLGKYQSVASDKIALEILKAKDPFMAAAIMQKNELYYGKGDMKSIIEILTHSDPIEYNFRELGKKLGLFKHGLISRKILNDPDNT